MGAEGFRCLRSAADIGPFHFESELLVEARHFESLLRDRVADRQHGARRHFSKEGRVGLGCGRIVNGAEAKQTEQRDFECFCQCHRRSSRFGLLIAGTMHDKMEHYPLNL